MFNLTCCLICVAVVVVSYLLGGVNGAIILSSLVYHEDIRDKGSKNPGFTNFKRVYGNSFVSWSVIIIDVCKTALPVLVSALIFKNIYDQWQFGAQLAGLGCMLGHCFPVWYGFRGGKAFMTGFATIWFVDWRMALIATGIFMILLFTVKIMSISSCVAALSCPISLFIIGPSSTLVGIMVAAGSLLIILRHYPNFVKLAHGEESKFSLRSKK